jgi:hypothetical protein
MENVYVPRSAEEKKMQRALLQYYKPENKAVFEKALKIIGNNSGNNSEGRSKNAKSAKKSKNSTASGTNNQRKPCSPSAATPATRKKRR